MCCCIAPRCSIIFAGVLCLIQSIVWTIFGIIGISLHTCAITVENSIENPLFYLYFVYFYNKDCGYKPKELDLYEMFESMFPTPPDVTSPGFTIPPEYTTTPFPIPDWPDPFSQVEFTQTVASLYVGFNVAWAVTCIIAIVAAAWKVRNWFAYVPWILLAAANIVLDVVATINYVNDALNAQTPRGLLETVIGLDLTSIPSDYSNYVDQFFESDVLKAAEPFTMIPSVVMALLTSRLGILWLLNVLFLICVTMSVFRLPKKQGRVQHLTTHPPSDPRNQGISNKSYNEETHTNEPGPQHDQFDKQLYSRPHVYNGGDLRSSSTNPPHLLTNGDPASSVAVPGTNRHSHITPPYYLELVYTQQQQQQQRYHQPSAAVDNYERQALNRMPVTSHLKGINGADEQIRAPHNHRPESERSSQPPIKKRPAPAVPFPRADLHSPAARPDEEYLEPRQGLHNSLASPDNYKPLQLSRPSVANDVRENSEPNGQRRAPHLHRTESDRLYRPPALTTNVRRRSSARDEVDRTQDHKRNSASHLPGSVPSPTASQPPTELRNQLPWSYFGPRNAPNIPKPIQESVTEEDLEKPPVPVPDYTLHFGKTARPVASQWSDDATTVTDSVASPRGTSAIELENNRY